MNDDQISRFLHERASAIEVPPGDAGAVTGRAVRRRRRRKGLVSGAALAVMALVAVAVVDRGDGGGDDFQVAAQGTAVIESPFDWTTVEPGQGLGPARAIVSGPSGDLYGLSTAPGVVAVEDQDPWEAPTLYRSADGTDWEPAALPAGLWASALTTSGDELYALGTAPAAAGTEVVLAAHDGTSWAETTLDLGIAELQERYGTEVSISGMEVAEGPDGPVVATVVRAWPDVESRLPAEHAENSSWRTTDEGVDVYAATPDCAPEGAASTLGSDPTSPTTSAPTSAPTSPAEQRSACTMPEVEASYTWDELGVDGELRALLGGQLRVASVGSEGPTEALEVPIDGSLEAMELVPVGDTVALVVDVRMGPWDAPQREQRVFRSSDGRTWEADLAGTLPGSVLGAGLVDGRLAIAAGDPMGGSAELRIAAEGGWSRIDLAGPASGSAVSSFGEVAFGPLGFAGLRWVPGDDGSTSAEVVHTTDGSSLSVVPLPRGDGTRRWPVAGLAVTADAITVRMSEGAIPADGGQLQNPATRLLVGTPKG